MDGTSGSLLLVVMGPDVITVAEYDRGIQILSVVRPVGEAEAEHLFQVTRDGRLVGEAATIGAASAIVDHLLSA